MQELREIMLEGIESVDVVAKKLFTNDVCQSKCTHANIKSLIHNLESNPAFGVLTFRRCPGKTS